MDTIMIGHFQEQALAEAASHELYHAGVPSVETCLFFLNPQGQHNRFPIGGDQHESAGTHDASAGAVVGALEGGGAGALLGAALMPVMGPAGPLLAAAVGATGGTVAGALSRMEHEVEVTVDPSNSNPQANPTVAPRKSGYVLAVAVPTPERRDTALSILRRHTQDIEEATGTMLDGDWVDFDPLGPRKAVH